MALHGEEVAHQEDRTKQKDGTPGRIEMRQKAPANQCHGKREWNNVILDEPRIEKNDAEQQHRKPLTEGKLGAQIPAREMKQHSEYRNSIQKIDGCTGNAV